MREIIKLKDNWHFLQDDCAGAEKIGFDDSKWETVSVPHDWAIKGPFDELNDLQITRIKEDGEDQEFRHSGRTGGLPTIGKAWYRLQFELPESIENEIIKIEFDGVMSHSKVYCNGEYVNSWPYGYSSFSFDLTKFAKSGSNTLAVSIDNKPNSSRWYPGAGIYRNVRLLILKKAHIAHWGTYITTPEVSTELALVKIQTTIENHLNKADIELDTAIYQNDKLITSLKNEYKNQEPRCKHWEYRRSTTLMSAIKPTCGIKNKVVSQDFEIKNPLLWIPHSPNLYKAVSTLKIDGKICDKYSTTFGIRSLDFDPVTGFKINGESMQFKGVCMHHDLGPLGAAVNRTALKRQLLILQDMGCNAIRGSHNPPTPELLELCDKMGFLFIDEAFDEWEDVKCENGYNTLFDKWAEKDLRAMIKRDRNHPSVIMWSIGNEIREQDHKDGVKAGEFLNKIAHNEDPTRPTTAGFNNSEGAIEHGLADVVDVPGWNYKPYWYGRYHNEHPDWPMYGSETASCLSSRGEYYLPLQEEVPPSRDNLQANSFDIAYAFWGTPPEVEFRSIDDNPSIMGEFVWTGFDYLGEPSPYGTKWPARSSYFGIVDLCGIPKDRFYLYKSRWSDKKVLHLLPHWNWEGREGELTPVHCYTNYPSVELFMNGKSYGKRSMSIQSIQERYRLIWNNIPYKAGELKAVAYDNEDNITEEAIIKTAGTAAGIKFTIDSTFSAEEDDDLIFINVKVVDKDGNLCPRAENLINFNLKGDTKIVAVGNGNAATTEPFIANYRKAFNGQCMVYLQKNLKSNNKIEFSASSKGLASSTLNI